MCLERRNSLQWLYQLKFRGLPPLLPAIARLMPLDRPRFTRQLHIIDMIVRR
jgi:hypothetical protein